MARAASVAPPVAAPIANLWRRPFPILNMEYPFPSPGAAGALGGRQHFRVRTPPTGSVIPLSRQRASRRSARCRPDQIGPRGVVAKSRSRRGTLGGPSKRDSTVAQLQMNFCVTGATRHGTTNPPPSWPGSAPDGVLIGRRCGEHRTDTQMSPVHQSVTYRPCPCHLGGGLPPRHHAGIQPAALDLARAAQTRSRTIVASPLLHQGCRVTVMRRTEDR